MISFLFVSFFRNQRNFGNSQTFMLIFFGMFDDWQIAIVEICCKTFQPRPGSPLLRQGQSVRDLSRGQVFFIYKCIYPKNPCIYILSKGLEP